MSSQEESNKLSDDEKFKLSSLKTTMNYMGYEPAVSNRIKERWKKRID